MLEVRASARPEVYLSRALLAPRRLESGTGGFQSRYEIAIEHYAGEAELLVVAGEESRRLQLDIAPNREKLGREEHRALLEDLEARVEGLLAGLTGGDVRLAATCTGHLAPPLARYARFRTRTDSLVRAFAAISERPHRMIRTEREERPLHRVRRPDGRTVRSVLARPGVRAALRGERGGTSTVDHPLRVETFDTPVNRYVKGLIVRLLETARGLGDEFDRVGKGAGPGKQSEEARARACAFREDCASWILLLRRMLLTPFLAPLRVGTASPEAFQVLAGSPPYRRLDGVARSILSPRAPLEPKGLPLPLRPTYELYELWCLLRLADDIRLAHSDARWSGFREFVSGGLLVDIGRERVLRGDLPGGGAVELWYQPTFAAYTPGRGATDLSSVSGELRPDFILRWLHADGSLDRFMVLDAKYRSSRTSIHEALRSLHIYRDALRWDGTAPIAAFALCPAVAPDAAVYSAPEYCKAHGIGVLILNPGRGGGDSRRGPEPTGARLGAPDYDDIFVAVEREVGARG